ncbi:hypothetical protein [Anabaena lutea]|uniref:Uncharacterized protein n=1 Tax=Anabaena lutea FACHB-196 TaxID=2692881 RepID=A0ABR8FDA7_9NOST|nr:hypothetical protein [Anabaena lutea]MBD2568213.1 hypothetical protein [Anabaena lutea FACHB-196]
MDDIKEILIEKGIIKVFDYQELDTDLIDTYNYFENKFQELYQCKADIFHLDNCFFYISNSYRCNAFAGRIENHNIIGITNGYPVLIKDKFNDNFFSNSLCIAFLNKKSISDAYCDLHEDQNFKLNEFVLNCSIEYTFGHEFQHILQFNSSKISKDALYSENLDIINNDFNLKKHTWEFDADRMASYEVLKYAFSVYTNLKNKDNEKLKCLFYIALASIVITKNLFYFGVMNQFNQEYTINKQDFYTKQFSHPHPLVRIFNIIDYFYDNVKDDFPKLEIDSQELFNNVLGISTLYFNNLIPNQNVMENFNQDIKDNIDEIYRYSQELYDFAIKDKSIKKLLKKRGIKF